MQGTSVERKEKSDAELQKTVRCKTCEHVLTTPERAIQPHEHTFRNPLGYSFHILLYSDAPGTTEIGQPTAEATWFPGCAWSAALCNQCHQHLGWWWSGREHFVGLIATRVKRSR